MHVDNKENSKLFYKTKFTVPEPIAGEYHKGNFIEFY